MRLPKKSKLPSELFLRPGPSSLPPGHWWSRGFVFVRNHYPLTEPPPQGHPSRLPPCRPSCCLVAKSCLTLCGPVDCSPTGSSVHRISQARIPEWIAISFSRGSSRFRDWTRVSCITGGFFTNWATREHSTNIYWVCILGLTLDAEHRVMNRSNKNPYSLKFIADSWRSSLTVIVKWNINIRGKI